MQRNISKTKHMQNKQESINLFKTLSPCKNTYGKNKRFLEQAGVNLSLKGSVTLKISGNKVIGHSTQ